MVDGRCASVGTANMDIRSFELNFEVNATIYHEATVEVLEKNFLADIQDCREMTCTDYENRGIVRGIVQRVKEQVSRLLSPLL
jgi:cardiolipin synthetase